MDLLDVELVQLIYIERLREAERNRRYMHLGFDPVGEAPVIGANGLLDQIRQWLQARNQRRAARDVRRPHAA